MQITARDAIDDDLDQILRLYEELATEQAGLRPLWRESEGFADPTDESLAKLIAGESVTAGVIDGIILGFLITGQRLLVDDDERVGVIRYIYTEPEARGIGLADEMFRHAIAKLRSDGVQVFDAIVSPGHREAKNFYEAHGFSARSIVMHSSDPVTE